MTVRRVAAFRVFGLAAIGILAARPGVSENLPARVDAFLAPYVATNNFSGAVLIARDGSVLLRKGYGRANHELSVPNTPDTRFQLASLSKAFTATGVLILEQQGRLSVEDPLGKFLEGYPNGEKITIHHLLTHRTGIPNVNSFPEYEEKSRFPQKLADPIALFKDRPLIFAPGEKFQYSNSNYNLLAAVIEKASGLPFGEFLERHVFAPAGMRHTGHRGDAGRLIPSRASGYMPVGRDALAHAPYLDWTIKTGNGSVYSTVEDLYRFDRALRGTTLLTAASKEKAFRDHGEGVGYGCFVSSNHGRRVASMSGRSPGFNSWLERSLDDDLVVILLSNNYSSIGQTLGRQLLPITLGEKHEDPLAAYSGARGSLPAAYLGEYEFGPDFGPNPGLTVRLEQGPDGPVMRTPGESHLIPAGPMRFVDRMYGGVVTFVTNAGAPTALKWNFGSDYVAQKKPAPPNTQKKPASPKTQKKAASPKT
ncbi:MAG: serine hydrolase domain-containing protein [Thermoanaerobaculia bacterium]